MIRKFALLLLLFSIGTTAYAGVTGKIAGSVIDKNTQEPLPGVNITLEGTTIGSSTDIDGYYVILNIPPGVYTLKAQYVGYQDVIVKEVKVVVDLTTTIDIEMSETTLETSEAITIVAERPIIRKDEISTKHFVSSEEIEIQPVNSFQEIAQNQAGVVGSHFRGGRSGEVLVLIDGIPLRDQAGNYSGNLGGFTSDVPEYAIEEMEVSLGGFSAEYGNVQSGIINLALKEGAVKYAGRLRYTHQSFGAETEFEENGFKFNRLQPVQNIWELNLSGPVPFLSDRLSFSLSGEWTDRNQGFYMNQQRVDQSGQAKITYRITPQMKLAVGGLYSYSEWDQFYYPASYYGPGPNYVTDEYNAGVNQDSVLSIYHYVTDQDLFGTVTPEDRSGTTAEGDSFLTVNHYYMSGMQDYLWDRKQSSTTAYLLWTHTLNSRTFYEVRLNSFGSGYTYYTPDVDDRDGDGDRDEAIEWDLDKPGPHPIYRERESNYWWVRGDDPAYLDQDSWTNSVKMDLVSQVTKNHLLKGGLELMHHRTKVENVSWSLGVGFNRLDIWEKKSVDFGAYVQDKLEFAGIIGLIGLRFDAFSPHAFGDPVEYPDSYERPFSEIGEDGEPILIDPQKTEVKYKLSPRIGISHPITDRSVLHFTYGHYFQRPDAYYLFRNYQMQALTKVGNFVGNPSLNPEKTVAYEIGVEQQISNDMKFTVTGYYKDVTELMNWEKYVGRTIQNRELNVYTNADYGNIKGAEFTFTKRPGRFWGGSINYTYSIAKGRSSSASGGSGSFTSVKRMNILSFDQTHTVNANITLRTPDEFGFNFAGIYPIGKWLANIQFEYGSGLPYSSVGTNKVNDQRLPWTSTTDIKIIRKFMLGNFGVNVFMDIYNLFNRKNVNFIGNARYYDNGDANNPTIKGDPSVVFRAADGVTYYRNPQAYSAGRQLRFGLGLFF